MRKMYERHVRHGMEILEEMKAMVLKSPAPIEEGTLLPAALHALKQSKINGSAVLKVGGVT